MVERLCEMFHRKISCNPMMTTDMRYYFEAKRKYKQEQREYSYHKSDQYKLKVKAYHNERIVKLFLKV